MIEYFKNDKKILDNREAMPNKRGGSRRLHQRFHVNVDAMLECGNILYKGAIVDISKRGCRVVTNSAIRTAATHVTLKYIFPGERDSRNVRGKIKWMEQEEKKCLIGIEFEKLQHF